MDKNRYPFWALALLLITIVSLLYSVSLGHNFYFDEENIILKNPTIRSFKLIPEIFKHGYFYFHGQGAANWNEYYRPFTSITYTVDYFFWGVNPMGYNLTNLFFHLLLCVLFFRFLEKLLDHRLAAFLAALLYSVHTIHTEAVTYTASRGDTLGIVLMLSAMLVYLNGRTLIALCFYFLALFSKETMMLLPFYILALDLGFVKSSRKDLARRALPFFALMILFWFYRKFWCPIPFAPFEGDLKGMLLRMLGMGDGILQYLRALLAPEYFRPFSDVPELYDFSDPLIWTAVTVGALLLAGWLFTLRRMSLGFIGMSILLMGLAPHFQILKVYPKWAEHYICISALGLFLLLGILIRQIFLGPKKLRWILLLGVYLPFLFMISFRTWQRNETYNDPERYYFLLSQTDTPYRFYGYQQMARAALEREEVDLAGVYLEVALAQEFRSEYTHELKGHYFLKKDRPKEALHEFRLAYYYSSKSLRQLQFIGSTLIELGRYRDAIKIFLIMKQVDPGAVAPYTQMMTAYELLNEPASVHQWSRAGLEAFRSHHGFKVSLQMALAKFYYRSEQWDLARKVLGGILAASEKRPPSGNTDLARFFLGKIETTDFVRLVEIKYPYYQSLLPSYLVMREVLQDHPQEVRSQLKKNHQKLAKLSKKYPLVKRELRVAQRFLAS